MVIAKQIEIRNSIKKFSDMSYEGNPAIVPRKDDNLEKLRVIGDLKDNWNQNGATAFSGKLITKVRNVLDKITVQPEIFPTALGTIQLEFDNSRRDHMEIEIGESGDAEVFVSMYNRKEYFETIPATPDAVNKKVGEFYG